MIYTIIVTYNGSKWVRKCLDSVILETNVVIVDNCSTDDTLEILKGEYARVNLIESKENLGFGAANNIGIKYALDKGADYVFLLNQDAWIQKGTIQVLKDALIRNNNFGVFSPIHLNGDGSKLDKNFGQYFYRFGGRKFITDSILKRKRQKIVELDFVNAACWLISKKCIQTVGLFDPIFFHYGEDDNYLQRVKYHGFKVGVETSSFLFHDRENTLKANSIKDFSSEIRGLKVRWADVNKNEKEILDEISIRVSILKKLKLKAFIKMNFQLFKKYQDQLEIITKAGDESIASRQRNHNAANLAE